eukprot:TRINITY_DN56614_c0_g1_i1.p1 TRINITY_DN56614_c0_g1~~TRINITY_DN56614_c0_g1_i1.p1  ORF type:complete len:168 (+),score=39.24 TRINITY_DN56614_c0_g1_i1:67-570(+)
MGGADAPDESDEDMGMQEGSQTDEPQMSREAALQMAQERVRSMAVSSQQEALCTLRASIAELDGVVRQAREMGVTVAGGASPLMLVVHALQKLLGATWDSISSGQALLHALETWDPRSLAAATRDYLEKFAEDHSEDPKFAPGGHWTNACESSLFEWVDAALTLATN